MRVELGFTPVWPSPQTPGGLPPPKELGFPVNPKAPVCLLKEETLTAPPLCGAVP